MSALTAVLDAIARAVLGDAGDAGDAGNAGDAGDAGSAGERAVTIGAVTLRAHQRDALRRVRASVERAGGALLADEPGLGKTFVALALAREYAHTIVVAPAALRAMWRRAAAMAGVDAEFVSMEALSRRAGPAGRAGPPAGARIDFGLAGGDALVIVDEAQHVCNPATARYARLARLSSYRHVLLLSATPVRNRRAELGAMLALFMGPRAFALDDAALARCMVRRGGDASLRPAIDGPHWHRVRSLPGLRAAIERLPPPLPAFDGREAAALLSISLARSWASSLAALDATLRRRLQRGAALGALLDAGRMPTRDELRAWVVGDDAVQLALPMLAAHEAPNAARLREVLDEHLGAVRALRMRIRSQVSGDTMRRTRMLLELRHAHAGARIVAFTSHAATAEALYRALRRERGVALLSARGARTAGGARPRADVIDALGADAATQGAPGWAPGGGSASVPGNHASRCPPVRDEISLVITTDLLSEGVNLQGASVIVHLDVPWTPAGLDQRVGRAARMGSRHASVHVHGISPPAEAERLLALDRRLRRKQAEQAEAARASLESEKLRALVHAWRSNALRDAAAGLQGSLVTHVHSERPGFIAVVKTQGELVVVCGALRGRRRWTVSDAPGDLLRLARVVRGSAAAPDRSLETSARVALDRWLGDRCARESAGTAAAPSRVRRLVLARIDASVRSAAVHSRAALASRLARVRSLMDRAFSAGAERTLDELAHSGTADLESWLLECEARLDRASPQPARPARPARHGRDTPELRALLLLRRRP